MLDAPVSLDGKLMVSTTVTLLKAESFWTTIPISISAKGVVDAVGSCCWPGWSFCAVFSDGCGVSPARTGAGGGILGTAIVFPCLTSLSGFDDRLTLVLLVLGSDMAENDVLMSSSVVVVGSVTFFRRWIIDRSEESLS